MISIYDVKKPLVLMFLEIFRKRKTSHLTNKKHIESVLIKWDFDYKKYDFNVMLYSYERKNDKNA